jgi:replicative DNA helicase
MLDADLLATALQHDPSWELIERLPPEAFAAPYRAVFEVMVREGTPRAALISGDDGVQATTLKILDVPVVTTAHTPALCAQIVERHAKAQLRSLGGDIGKLCRSATSSEIVSVIESRVAGLTASRPADMEHASSGLRAVYDQIVAYSERPGGLTGVPSGLDDLDKLTGGFQAGHLIVVAGRPAMGKTALAMGSAQYAAQQDYKTLVASLEMAKAELLMRAVCSQARVNHQDVREGRLKSMDWKDITSAIGVIGQSSLVISDRTDVTIGMLRSMCRRCKDLRMLALDYLQLMTGGGRDREREIAEISRGLKVLAKDLGIPVICVSQLNRGVENRSDKRPLLADLRESGAIEQDADEIIFVYRPRYYDETAPADYAEAIVAKNRHGPTGVVKLRWDGRYTRFDNYYQGE